MERYARDGFQFLLQVFNNPDCLEDVSGLAELHKDSASVEVICKTCRLPSVHVINKFSLEPKRNRCGSIRMTTTIRIEIPGIFVPLLRPQQTLLIPQVTNQGTL